MFVIRVKYFYYRDYIDGETQYTVSLLLMVAIPVGSFSINTI